MLITNNTLRPVLGSVKGAESAHTDPVGSCSAAIPYDNSENCAISRREACRVCPENSKTLTMSTKLNRKSCLCINIHLEQTFTHVALVCMEDVNKRQKETAQRNINKPASLCFFCPHRSGHTAKGNYLPYKSKYESQLFLNFFHSDLK